MCSVFTCHICNPALYSGWRKDESKPVATVFELVRTHFPDFEFEIVEGWNFCLVTEISSGLNGRVTYMALSQAWRDGFPATAQLLNDVVEGGGV